MEDCIDCIGNAKYITNSQATFQRLMKMCLKDLKGVEVYVNDVVIFSDTWEEYLKSLEKVLIQLMEVMEL